MGYYNYMERKEPTSTSFPPYIMTSTAPRTTPTNMVEWMAALASAANDGRISDIEALEQWAHRRAHSQEELQAQTALVEAVLDLCQEAGKF